MLQNFGKKTMAAKDLEKGEDSRISSKPYLCLVIVCVTSAVISAATLCFVTYFFVEISREMATLDEAYRRLDLEAAAFEYDDADTEDTTSLKIVEDHTNSTSLSRSKRQSHSNGEDQMSRSTMVRKLARHIWRGRVVVQAVLYGFSNEPFRCCENSDYLRWSVDRPNNFSHRPYQYPHGEQLLVHGGTAIKIPKTGMYEVQAQVTFAGYLRLDLHQPRDQNYASITVVSRSPDGGLHKRLSMGRVTQLHTGDPMATDTYGQPIYPQDTVNVVGNFFFVANQSVSVKVDDNNNLIHQDRAGTYFGIHLIHPGL